MATVLTEPTRVRREPRTQRLDVLELANELARRVRGEVRFDAGSRALYATDASNYRQPPVGVVLPRDAADVEIAVAAARQAGVPLLNRGGGTSLAGQCCNHALLLDYSKYMNRILGIDPGGRTARIQPGVVLDHLRHEAERHHLTFGPDPATHNHCTLGGMIGNNSCGVHSVMAGKTVDNVESLEILTYDGLRMWVGPTGEEELERIIAGGGRRGQIYAGLRALRDRYAPLIRERYPDIPRRVSGYNLDQLLPENGFHVARALVGSESTCVTVLEAEVRLVPSPPCRTLVVLGYPDIAAAGDAACRIMEFGPIGLEGIDAALIGYMEKKGVNVSDISLLPEGHGWLLAEFGGESEEEADSHARRMIDAVSGPGGPSAKLFEDREEEEKVWAIRESGLGATAWVPGKHDTWPGWEDSAVPPERLGDYLRDLRGLFHEYDWEVSLYGHFGQGCVHCRIPFDLHTRDGINTYLEFIGRAADLVVSYGGSLSGEHGDGQARGDLLPRMFGEELCQAFREFKSLWDPDWRMNPGKVIDADPSDAHLRLGTAYNPPEPDTWFQYPQDQGSFSRAALRCVGVGKCRREGGGTMCPSYMVTHEEMHSTRGRARLLFEMLQGEVIGGGWRDEHMKEALDLCLACKGCKADCPVSVDMATYKAEFMAHYWEGRLRPRHAYAFGLIPWGARLGSALPRLANFFTQTPGLRRVAKALAGAAPERRLPPFATESFRRWYRRHRPANRGRPRVILWPDTFNNSWHPRTGRAAVEALETAGYHVVVPREWVCCGRPLYDYGFLGLAKHLLQRTLRVLRPELEAGTPIVGLEPSCVAVFRDELPSMLPHDEDACRMAAQTFLLSEFLQREGYEPPHLHRRAVVHGHCHHKSVMGMDAEEWLLSGLGLEYQVLDSGCCGMAGAFGFEHDKYDISIACGERVLLPAVRQAPEDSLIIANGFSCRTQIEETTPRRAAHVAEVLWAAQHPDRAGEMLPVPRRVNT